MRLPPSAAVRDRVFNLLAGLVLLATAGAGGWTGLVFVRPATPLNPFPPPTLPALAGPTAAAEFPSMEWTRTSTPAPTPYRTPTRVLAPTQTPTATQTAMPLPTDVLAPTATRTPSALPFGVQNGTPVTLSNFANTAGCNWMGIAGQAFDRSGKPAKSLRVRLEGAGVVLDARTGSAPAYGAGGYEFFLNNYPRASQGEYRVQLFADDGAPLSDIVPVDTFADCSKNLVLVNFVQNP